MKRIDVTERLPEERIIVFCYVKSKWASLAPDEEEKRVCWHIAEKWQNIHSLDKVVAWIDDKTA